MPLESTSDRKVSTPRVVSPETEESEAPSASAPSSSSLPFSSSEVPVGGHLVGESLGGPQAPENLFPLTRQTNTSHLALEEQVKRT